MDKFWNAFSTLKFKVKLTPKLFGTNSTPILNLLKHNKHFSLKEKKDIYILDTLYLEKSPLSI
jgi:hypothetical protein